MILGGVYRKYKSYKKYYQDKYFERDLVNSKSKF